MTSQTGLRRRSLRIAMIDPSLFTIPYDRAIVLGLSKAGHSVKLYGRRPGRDDGDVRGIGLEPDFYRLSSWRIVAGLPDRFRLPIKGLDHILSMLRLRSRLRSDQPDIVHFQWLALPVFDRHLLGGLRAIAPVILTVHDTNPFNGDPSASLQARGFAECLQLFDHLIVHTRQGRNRLLALGIAGERISLLPHGLLEELPSTVAPTARDGELTFLLFGKIKFYKGLDVLVEAFGRLPALLRSQARLRVVGKSYMPLGPILALAQKLGIADRLEVEARFVEDYEVNPLFGPNVVAVFPYREIEASGVLSYALANGRPVIASALGSFEETIENEIQGLLVPPNDVAALSGAMARMIIDRAFVASCGVHARKLAEVVTGWDTIATQTVAAYESAAKSRAVVSHRVV